MVLDAAVVVLMVEVSAVGGGVVGAVAVVDGGVAVVAVVVVVVAVVAIVVVVVVTVVVVKVAVVAVLVVVVSHVVSPHIHVSPPSVWVPWNSSNAFKTMVTFPESVHWMVTRLSILLALLNAYISIFSRLFSCPVSSTLPAKLWKA